MQPLEQIPASVQRLVERARPFIATGQFRGFAFNYAGRDLLLKHVKPSDVGDVGAFANSFFNRRIGGQQIFYWQTSEDRPLVRFTNRLGQEIFTFELTPLTDEQ